MGLSWWADCVGQSSNRSAPCDPMPSSAKPSPLPLFANTTIIDQPAGLYTLTARYAAAASDFIFESGDRPFLLYLPFNHVHSPQSCSSATCGTSARGMIGDAVADVDRAVGTVMDRIRSGPASGRNTLVFFTSDNGSPLAPDGNLPLRGYKHQIWEGGYREPGIAWWPGKIKPGSSAPRALVATYDIFPTVLSLAGAPFPPVHIDGLDLTQLLLSPNPEAVPGHDCIAFYHAPQSQDGPEGAAALTSLAAVRCGDHKVYWFIDKISQNQPLSGVTPGPQSLAAPVIFDLSSDWNESTPLAPGSTAWVAAKAAADTFRTAHLATIGWAPNQMALGTDPEYAICSDPRSQQRYHDFPNCTISPSYWTNPYCSCGGNRFRLCSECPSPPPPPPPEPHFPPTNSTNCTYSDGTRYNHRVSHGDAVANVGTREKCCKQCYLNDECVVAAWHTPNAPEPEMCYLHYSAEGAGRNQAGVVGCVTTRH